MVIEWLPEVTTEAHRRDVVYYFCDLTALHAQRMLTEEGTTVLTPHATVVARLLVPPLVHLFARLRFWHAWHYGSDSMMSMTMIPT